jgi:hypothetical protein
MNQENKNDNGPFSEESFFGIGRRFFILRFWTIIVTVTILGAACREIKQKYNNSELQ